MNKKKKEKLDETIGHSIPVEFSYQGKISNLISSFKVSIMYAGPNRNGSYFSEDAVRKIGESIRGVPIVGHYSEEKEDFQGHGDLLITDDGMEVVGVEAYGFVPTDANVFKEERLDKDGVRREYLSVEAYLWTGRYPELEIVKEGMSNQSMELNPESMEFGGYIEYDGAEYLEIVDAELMGLCILGQDVEPCFEGAGIESMFSYSALDNALDKMEKELSRDLTEFSLEEEQEDIEEEDIEEVQEDEKEEEVVETTEEEEIEEEEEENLPTEEDILSTEEVEVPEDIKELEKEIEEAAELAEIESGDGSIYKEEEDIEEEEEAEDSEEEEVEEEIEEIEEPEEKEEDEIEEEEEEDKEDLQEELHQLREMAKQAQEFAELQEENEKLKKQIDELEEELKDFRLEKELEEKHEILEQYSDTLTGEQIDEFTNKLEDYSHEELEIALLKKGFHNLKNKENVKFSAFSAGGTGTKNEASVAKTKLASVLDNKEKEI